MGTLSLKSPWWLSTRVGYMPAPGFLISHPYIIPHAVHRSEESELQECNTYCNVYELRHANCINLPYISHWADVLVPSLDDRYIHNTNGTQTDMCHIKTVPTTVNGIMSRAHLFSPAFCFPQSALAFFWSVDCTTHLGQCYKTITHGHLRHTRAHFYILST